MAKGPREMDSLAPVARPRGGGCSARKAAKRAIYPWINSQIVAVAESGNFAQLVATVQIHAPQMNLVNLATALHRMARLAQGDPGAQLLLTEGAVLENTANHVMAALGRARCSAGPPQCQALANITWSHASMGYVDLPLLETVADLALRSIAGFKPFELSTILWAFAKLGTHDPEAWDISRDLFAVGACQVASSPEDFPFRCLVMTAWAFATAGRRDQELFRGIAPRMAALAHGGSCRELATALWAFCDAGVRDEGLLMEITKRAGSRLEDLSAEELKGMMRSLAKVNFLPKVFLERAMVVAEDLDDEALRVAKALLVLARPLGGGGAGAGQAAERGGRRRRPKAGSGSFCGSISSSSGASVEAEEFSGRPARPLEEAPLAQEEVEGEQQHKELVQAAPASAAGAVGEAPGACAEVVNEEVRNNSHDGGGAAHGGDEPQTSPKSEEEGGETDTGRRTSASQWASAATWTRLVTVKNTFLHVDEEGEEESGETGAAAGISRRLPQPLEIIPRDVSPDRLTAYRTDYQRFRAGCAAGARGELVTRVSSLAGVA